MSDKGYVNYLEIFKLQEDCKPGEVRNAYKRLMKDLIFEISRTQMTPDKRDRYFLELARHNAAFYILRDNARRAQYLQDRHAVIELEDEWRAAMESGAENREQLRRSYDAAVKHFLARYMEELVFEAGRDPECVEASGWDAAHERHAERVLRHYRQRLYHEIHERLPFYQVTKPDIDWDERSRCVLGILAGKG